MKKINGFSEEIFKKDSVEWVPCRIEKDFIEGLKLMMLSHPRCLCSESFLEQKNSLFLPELPRYIFSGAPYNINNYAKRHNKEVLVFSDLIKIFWDSHHIFNKEEDPKVFFGHILNPIYIDSLEENKAYGQYLGTNSISVKSLFNPFNDLKEGQIVVAHFAMIIGIIDKDWSEKIIEHQKNDSQIVKLYNLIDEVDYCNYNRENIKDLFGWTAKNYQSRLGEFS